MNVAVQLMMGLSLAACAGLRAWLPLFLAGLLARFGYLPLGEGFQFLARPDVLLVFGVATVLELIGDKVVVVDNLLDAAGTLVRPVAGTVLAASVLTGLDPALSLVLGLIVGGGTALTVHTGKAVARAHATATAPLHAGAGNAALSLGEDVASATGVSLVAFLPLVAFIFALIGLLLAFLVVRAGLRRGASLFALFRPRTPRVS